MTVVVNEFEVVTGPHRAAPPRQAPGRPPQQRAGTVGGARRGRGRSAGSPSARPGWRRTDGRRRSPRRGRPSSSAARRPRRSPRGCCASRCDETQDGLSSCEATFGNWGPTRAGSASCTSAATSSTSARRSPSRSATARLFDGPDHRPRGHVPRRRPAGGHGAGRGPVPGPADDPPHAHVRRADRRAGDPLHRPRPRADPAARRQRPDPHGPRPAQPERPRLPARARPGDRRRAVDGRPHAARRRALAPARRAAPGSATATSSAGSPCSPTWPSSAPASS